MELKKKTFLITFMASIILIGFTATISSSTNLSVYSVSYIHYKSQSFVNLQWASLFLPLFSFSETIFYPLGGPIENKLGPFKTLIISSAITLVLGIIYSVTYNIYLTFIVNLLFGFGIVMFFAINCKNCCLFYPKNKGLITAILTCLNTVFSAIFTLAGEKIVNPDGKSTNNEGFYDVEISENLYKYCILMVVFSVVGIAVGLFFFRKYDEKLEESEQEQITMIQLSEILTKDNENEKEKEDKNNEDNEALNLSTRYNNETAENIEQGDILSHISSNIKNPKPFNHFLTEADMKKIYYKKCVKEAICSRRIWLTILISVCGTFLLNYVHTTFRTFAALTQTSESDGKIIQYLSIIVLLCYLLLSPAWGFSFDYFGYIKVIRVLCALNIINGIILCAAMQNKYMYRFSVCFTGIISSGFLTVISSHVMEVFGIDFVLEVDGFQGIFSGLATLIGAMISFIFSFKYKTGDELMMPYRIVHIIGTVLTIVSGVFVFWEDSSPFLYSEVYEQYKGENKITDINKDEIKE